MAGWGTTTTGFSATIASFTQLRERWGEDAYYVAGASAEYAVYLELGTSRMPAYPFIQPAVADARSEFDSLVGKSNGSEDLVRRFAEYVAERARHYASTNVPPGPDVRTGTLRDSIYAEEQ